MVTFVVLGAGYGILMQKHGYGPLWSLLSGIVIFSGTAQFVSVSMLDAGSLLMAAVTALMVSARHIFFSISMIGRYNDEGRRKWYLYYGLCDETYAMLSRDDGPKGVNTGAGLDVEIKLFAQMKGKKYLEGQMIAYDGNTVTVIIDGKETKIELNKIAKINQAVKFD